MLGKVTTGLITAFLVVMSAFASPAAAADIDAWMSAIARRAPRIAHSWVTRYDKKVVEFNAKVAASLTVSQPMGKPVFDVSKVVMGKNATADGVKLTFGKYDKKRYEKKYYVMRWVVPLDQKTPFMIKVSSNALAVYLDKEELVLTRGYVWSEANANTPWVHSRRKNSVVTVFTGAPLSAPLGLSIMPGNGIKRMEDYMRTRLKAPGNDDSIRVVRDVLNQLAREAMPGEKADLLLDGMIILRDYSEKHWNAPKLDQNRRTQLRDEYVRQLQLGMTALFPWEQIWLITQLRENGLSWALDKMTAVWWSDSYMDMLYREQNQAEIEKTIKAYLENGWKSTNPKTMLYVIDRLNRYIHYRILANGHPDLAMRILDFIAEHYKKHPVDKKDKKTKALRDRLYRIGLLTDVVNQRKQVELQLADDPEAPQHYLEFTRLLERGEEDARAVDSVFSLFRKHGSEMQQIGSRLINLRVSMLSVLKKKPKFFAALRNVARLRVKNRIQTFFDRSDLDSLEDLILVYGSLIDTEKIHRRLADEYMDRCEYEAARRHALLLRSPDGKLLPDAMARIIILEKMMNADPHQRTPLEKEVETAGVSWRGQKISLKKLGIEYGLKNIAATTTSGPPGKYLGSILLPRINSAYTNGSTYYTQRSPVSSLQPVSPIVSGEQILLGGPGFIMACNSSNGRELWKHVTSGDQSSVQYSENGHEFALSVGSGKVMSMLAQEQGYGIRAVSTSGRSLWDTSDYEISATWKAACAPMQAFGTYFTIVFSRATQGSTQVAVAQLDSETGRITNILPINEVSHTYSLSRIRLGRHFVTDDKALYGWTGSGAAFRINRENLAIEWVTATSARYPETSWRADTPGFVQAIGENLVCFLPGAFKWMGLKKTDGDILWERADESIRFIHSRNSSKSLIVSRHVPYAYSHLLCIDPATGGTTWSVSMSGVRITGEGSVLGDEVYIPARGGIAVFSTRDGKLTRFLPMKDTPLKIRESGGRWFAVLESEVHVFDTKGDFKGTGTAPRPPRTIAVAEPGEIDTSFETPHVTAAISLPMPERELGQLRVVPTSKPYHYLLSGGNSVALVREAYTAKNGQQVQHKTLWSGGYSNKRIDGDRILWCNTNQLGIIDCFTPDKPIYKYISPSSRQPALSHNWLISRAEFSGDLLGIRFNNGSVTVINTATSATIGFLEPVGDFRVGGNVIVATRRKGRTNVLVGYRIGKDVRQIWEMPFRPHYYFDFHMGLLVAGQNDKKAAVIDPNNGKIARTIDVDHIRYLGIHAGRYVSARGRVTDITDGKAIGGVVRAMAGHLNQGMLVATGNALLWMENGKSKALPPLSAGQIKSIRDRRFRMVAVKSGNQIITYDSNDGWATVYSLGSGKFLKNRYLPFRADHGMRLRLLKRSMMVTYGNKCHFVNWGLDSRTPVQATSYPTASPNSRWPQENWLPPAKLDRTSWIPNGTSNPPRAYQLSVGADRKFAYIRLDADRSPLHDLSSQLELAVDWHQSYPLLITWPLQRAENARARTYVPNVLESWSIPQRNGKTSYFLKINRKAWGGPP